MLLDQVPPAGPHDERRGLGLERVALPLGTGVRDGAGDRVAHVLLASQVVLPRGCIGILEVRHEDVRPRVEGVDHHLALHGAGDLDAAVGQVGTDRCDRPVAIADLFRLGQEVGQPTGIELLLAFAAPRQPSLALRLEAAGQRAEELERRRLHNLGTAGGWGGEDADAGIARGHGRKIIARLDGPHDRLADRVRTVSPPRGDVRRRPGGAGGPRAALVGGDDPGARRAAAARARRPGGDPDGGPPRVPCPQLRRGGGDRAHRAGRAPTLPRHDHLARSPPGDVRAGGRRVLPGCAHPQVAPLGEPARPAHGIRARSRRGPLQRRGGRADAAPHGVRAGALQAGRSLLDRAPAPARAPGRRGVRLRDLRRGHPAGDIRGTRLHDRSAGAARAGPACSLRRRGRMLVLKLLQSLFKALHSEGTPGQLAAGLALGSILGLTPLWNLHNAVVFALIIVLNVSFAGAMLGWALFVPVGFLLDTPALRPLWTALYNAPVVPLTSFNNTIVLGSLVVAAVLWVPLFFASRWGVVRYRATVAERVKRSALYRSVVASKLYNLYRLFRPEA